MKSPPKISPSFARNHISNWAGICEWLNSKPGWLNTSFQFPSRGQACSLYGDLLALFYGGWKAAVLLLLKEMGAITSPLGGEKKKERNSSCNLIPREMLKLPSCNSCAGNGRKHNYLVSINNELGKITDAALSQKNRIAAMVHTPFLLHILNGFNSCGYNTNVGFISKPSVLKL